MTNPIVTISNNKVEVKNSTNDTNKMLNHGFLLYDDEKEKLKIL